MYVPETEEEQIEQLKGWLKDYGPSFIIGVVLALAVGFGWNYWQQRQLRLSEQASIEYTRVLNDLVEDNVEDARTKAQAIITTFKRTPYALWSAMTLAKLDASQKKYDDAKTHLQWVIDNAKDVSIKQTARLRLATILLTEKNYDLALRALIPIEDATFNGLIEETKGDIYSAQGDKQKAVIAYKKAVDILNTQGIAKPFLLTMKLQNADTL